MDLPTDILDDELSGERLPEFYSPTAIMWYSVLFTPVSGGALFFINLISLRRHFLGYLVLFGCIIYSTAVVYLTFLIPYSQSRGIVLLMLHLVGGNILTVPLWRAAFANKNYIKKNSWKPLIVILALYIIVLLVRYFLSEIELPVID